MAKRIMRVFIELDYPEDMPDPLDPNADPIRLFTVIRRILDAGVIEKVFNLKGELTDLNSVDGATIRPKYDVHGNLHGYRNIINGFRR